LFLIGTLVGMAAPVYAQQPAAAATPPAASNGTQAPADTSAIAPPVTQFTTSEAPAPTSAAKIPSPDTVKKAKDAGYRAKLRKGVTLFCKDEADIGTHFSTEHCINEDQLGLVLERAQAQRDQMTNHTCSNGGACNSK